MPITYMATAEELAAYREGSVKLAIVPSEVLMGESVTETSETGGGDPTSPESTEGSGEQGKGGTDEDPPTPTLDELLPTLDKPQLMEFARQNDVKFANNFSEEKLRERIRTVLFERAAQQPDA